MPLPVPRIPPTDALLAQVISVGSGTRQLPFILVLIIGTIVAPYSNISCQWIRYRHQLTFKNDRWRHQHTNPGLLSVLSRPLSSKKVFFLVLNDTSELRRRSRSIELAIDNLTSLPQGISRLCANLSHGRWNPERGCPIPRYVYKFIGDPRPPITMLFKFRGMIMILVSRRSDYLRAMLRTSRGHPRAWLPASLAQEEIDYCIGSGALS